VVQENDVACPGCTTLGVAAKVTVGAAATAAGSTVRMPVT
jgi:hypothetical protein